MTSLSRRTFMKGAGIGAVSVGAAAALSACASKSSTSSSSSSSSSQKTEYTAEVLEPTKTFDASTGHNFTPEPESLTTVGDTLTNLKSAVQGETNATTKYSAWAKIAESAGYTQIARLFHCTADAEKIHIKLEIEQIQKQEASYQQPAAVAAANGATDINVIHGAQGEIYETSDMYPSFIKAAQAEGNDEAVKVFTRAKLAEAYHAKHYMDAYNTIDTPSEDKYYLCPVCGYIHKGENFTACPICLTQKSAFEAY